MSKLLKSILSIILKIEDNVSQTYYIFFVVYANLSTFILNFGSQEQLFDRTEMIPSLEHRLDLHY